MQATHTPSKRELMLGKILQSCYRAARNCEQHLQAYSKLIPTNGETIPGEALPSRADYTPQQDREQTAKLLTDSKKMLVHLNHYRATYYATAYPTFAEDDDFADCPPPARDHHLYKACMWSLIMREVFDYYLLVGAPYEAKADATSLRAEAENLLEEVDNHLGGFLSAPFTIYHIEETFLRMMSFFSNGTFTPAEKQ